MARSKSEFAVDSFKHALLRWSREFGLGVNKDEAAALLDAARKIVDRTTTTEADPF